jgi:protein-disulfide isomerase-like protein with CxxC motif
MNARKNPNVTKAIMLQKAELAHKFAITPEKTAKMLWQISEEAYKKGQFNASVSAIRELNELAGLKVKKTENLNITASLDKMSHKDIEDRLKQIFGGDIVDAEFKDV